MQESLKVSKQPGVNFSDDGTRNSRKR